MAHFFQDDHKLQQRERFSIIPSIVDQDCLAKWYEKDDVFTDIYYAREIVPSSPHGVYRYQFDTLPLMPCVPRSRSASRSAFKVASGKEKLSNLLSRMYVFTYKVRIYNIFKHKIDFHAWFATDLNAMIPAILLQIPPEHVSVVTRVWLELVSTASGRCRPQIHKPTASKRQNNTATGQVSIKWFMCTELHLNPLNHHVHLSHNQGSPQIPRRVVERIRKMTCKQLSLIHGAVWEVFWG